VALRPAGHRAVEQREVACRRRAVWSGQRPAQALRVVAPRRRQAVPLGQALAQPPSVLAQAQVPAKRAVSGWSESRRRRGVVGAVRPAPRVLAKRDPEAANLSAKAAAPLLSVRRSAASPSEMAASSRPATVSPRTEEPAAGVGCASPREVAVVVAYALAPEPAVAAAVAQPDAVEQAVAAGEEPDAGPLPAAAAVPELLAAQAAALPSAVPVAVVAVQLSAGPVVVVAVQLSAGRAGAVEPPSAGLPAAPSSPSRRRPAQAPAPQPAACSLHVPQDLRIASRSARSLQAAEVEVCS
jgi:hypothetical protein